MYKEDREQKYESRVDQPVPSYFDWHPLATSVAHSTASSNYTLLQGKCGGCCAHDARFATSKRFSWDVVELNDVVKMVHKTSGLESGEALGIRPRQRGFALCRGAQGSLDDAYPIIARLELEYMKKGLQVRNGDCSSKNDVNRAMDRFHKTYGFQAPGVGGHAEQTGATVP